MIKLKDVKKLGLSITWRLLYKGVCERQLDEEDVIAYAIEKLEKGDTKSEVCELAGLYTDERDDILNLLWELTRQENTQEDFEGRKMRAVIVSNTLKTKDDNCINGLMHLTDLWISLSYPNDSPHIIQGKGNSIAPEDYYTSENYDYLYEKNVGWLKGELEYLKKRQ